MANLEGTAQLNKAEPLSLDSTPNLQEERDHRVPARVVTLIPVARPPTAGGQQSFQPTAEEISAQGALAAAAAASGLRPAALALAGQKRRA